MKNKQRDEINMFICYRGESIFSDYEYNILQKMNSVPRFDNKMIEYLNNFSKHHKELLQRGIQK